MARATTFSCLSWGLVPFDACRSEQRPTLGFQPQLCSAFRFSQPLDALLRSQPLRPCFIPVTPLGFRFRRVPLPGSRRRLSASPVLHAVSETTRKVGQDVSLVVRLRGFEHPESPFTAGRCYPVVAGRSSHSGLPLRGFSPVALTLCLPEGLLSWAFLYAAESLLPGFRQHMCSSEFQRTTE
jgi:hypothetical protein